MNTMIIIGLSLALLLAILAATFIYVSHRSIESCPYRRQHEPLGEVTYICDNCPNCKKAILLTNEEHKHAGILEKYQRNRGYRLDRSMMASPTHWMMEFHRIR